MDNNNGDNRRSNTETTEELIARVHNAAMQLRSALYQDDENNHLVTVQVLGTGSGGGKSGISPASRESIDAMPRIIVSDEYCGVKECVICLDAVDIGGEIREMPCHHGFHSGCIEKWLKIHGSCPVCRFVMPAQDDGDGGDEDGRRQRRRLIAVSYFVVSNPVGEPESPLGSGGSSDSASGLDGSGSSEV